jgi:general secretion pathway protein N
LKLAATLLFAFGCFIAALAAFLPATLVDRRLAAASNGKLRLADAAGTLWNGRGNVSDAAGTWRVPVGWTISKRSVVRGVHELVLRPIDGASSPQGAVVVVEDGIALSNVVLEIPAAALQSAMPAKGLAVTGGTLAVSSAAFAWNAAGGTGTLAAQWRNARLVVADTAADLGTIDLAVTPQGAALNGRITSTGGDVRINGTVTLASAAINVDATVTPAAAAPAAVARALAAIGTPDASGRVRIAWRGSLR